MSARTRPGKGKRELSPREWHQSDSWCSLVMAGTERVIAVLYVAVLLSSLFIPLQAYRAYGLIYDAFSVAEAVLPTSNSATSAAEVRLFHPPKDDTNVNRALLADG